MEYHSFGVEDFKYNLEAPITPWFKAWADEMGPEAGEQLMKAKDLVKSRFARPRLSKMLKLTNCQFEGVLTDAGANALWRPIAEEYLGAMFSKPSVPSSARLYHHLGIDDEAQTCTMRLLKQNGKASTIASNLSLSEIASSTVPQAALDVIGTPCPELNNITPGEMGKAATEVCAAFFCMHGTLSMGGAMIRHQGRLMRAHAKPPLKATGNDRFREPWAKAIAIKCSNWDRKDARVRLHLEPARRAPRTVYASLCQARACCCH
jgi:hypothetical protein